MLSLTITSMNPSQNTPVLPTCATSDATERCELIAQEFSKAVAGSHRFQNPSDGMRNARLKREDSFSQAMIIVISAMVSSS